jgi:UDP-N-acetylmuramate dehydrogenase
MTILEHLPLATRTTLGFEARARYWAEVRDSGELTELLRSDQARQGPVLVMGGGSNLLFTRDFDGLIISVAIRGVHVVKQDEEYVWVKAGAGEPWDQLVEKCVRAGFGGAENLSWIPGNSGAAPVQNIGAYGVELCEILEALEAVQIGSGEKTYFRNHECRFAYRDSVFKSRLADQYVITRIVLRLRKSPVLQLGYAGLEEMLNEMGVIQPSIRDVREAVIRIRSNKLPDPEKIGNAGSFFKNPLIDAAALKALHLKFPDLPSFPSGANNHKIPAAWLIERCGWKGLRRGQVGVHDRQALVLVHYGGGQGRELLALAREIQESVLSTFGIRLEEEVRII